MEFESFAKIERYTQPVTITEKVHGSNAQILVGEDGTIRAGSRTRWITRENDNYGFAAWVEDNKDALVVALGPGRHYGEWYGSGINAGYGLKEKRFALFNTFRWTPVKEAGGLPPRVDVVPVLYQGAYSHEAVAEAMAKLKEWGSVISPGFMHPEGVVIRFARSEMLLKFTFEDEEVEWKGQKAERAPRANAAEIEAMCAPYWQPLRLEKLMSRDEVFVRDYPVSLPALCKAYVEDLTSEVEIPEETLKVVKKNLFPAIKGMMAERGFSA